MNTDNFAPAQLVNTARSKMPSKAMTPLRGPVNGLERDDIIHSFVA